MTHLRIIKIEAEHGLVGIFNGTKHLCSVSVSKEDLPKDAKEGDEYSLRKKSKRTLSIKDGEVTKTENGKVTEHRPRRTK